MLSEGDLIECIPISKIALNLALKFSEFKFIITFSSYNQSGRRIKSSTRVSSPPKEY